MLRRIGRCEQCDGPEYAICNTQLFVRYFVAVAIGIAIGALIGAGIL